MLQDIEYTQPKMMTVSEFESLNLGAPIFVSYATTYDDEAITPEAEPK